MNPFISTLILISQLLNAWTWAKDEGFGHPDEMFCSRAWRLRKESIWWGGCCWFIDNATPLKFWKGSYSTHCEACYFAERSRIWKHQKYCLSRKGKPNASDL